MSGGRGLGALLACALLSGSAALRAAPTELGAPAVLRVSEAGVAAAALSSPRLAAARAALSSAEAEHGIAVHARLPDVLLSARVARLSSMPARYRTISIPTPDGGAEEVVLPQLLDGYAVRAALTVPLSDAWLGLAAAARAAGDAELALRRAWAARQIARTSLDVANHLAEGQSERVLAGTAAPSSQLTFDAARSDAAARVRSADVAVSAAEAALKVFLPRDAASLALEPDDAPPHARHGARGSSLSHPEERALAADVHAAEERTAAETLAMLPKLSLVAGADVTAPSPRAFALSRLVGVPAWDVAVQL
jgi:outer membrane protein TolC